MANTNDANVVHIDNLQRNNNGNNKKVLIITSTEDNSKILSCLATSSSAQTVIVNLNDASIIDTYQEMVREKRSRSPMTSKESLTSSKIPVGKRRKADLTCVICEGRAFGYNFDQITCESCKAFFRRNALHPLERTKCIGGRYGQTGQPCRIRFDVKNKCQRCRLQKCFNCGMRKDFILTPEEKVSKQRRIEENRRIRSTQTSSHEIKQEIMTSSTEIQPTIISLPTSTSFLTATDWACLTYIQSVYMAASQASPSASAVLPIELAPNNMSAFMYTFDIQNFTAVKLINFFRAIPEFDSLDERDRLMLVKYNLIPVFLVRHSISFDPARELCYEDDNMLPISPADEAFAHHCKSLFILCYGYEFNRNVVAVFHALFRLIGNDSMIAQLLMLVMIFLKGLSADDDHAPMLIDSHRVFNAQCKYTDLLYRYILERSSYTTAVNKMTTVVEQLMKIQQFSRDYQQHVKSKVNMVNINPLMKSLLHLT